MNRATKLISCQSVTSVECNKIQEQNILYSSEHKIQRFLDLLHYFVFSIVGKGHDVDNDTEVGQINDEQYACVLFMKLNIINYFRLD